MKKEMETAVLYGLYWRYIGIMEKKMETMQTAVFFRAILGVIGIMEKQMETISLGFRRGMLL